MKPRIEVGFYAGPSLRATLARWSEETGRPESRLVREAIDDFLEAKPEDRAAMVFWTPQERTQTMRLVPFDRLEYFRFKDEAGRNDRTVSALIRAILNAKLAKERAKEPEKA